MHVLPPITMTDAKLTSSTVPETPPAAYAGGTTYALDDEASVAGAAGLQTVYRSLQGSNTGHTPASSPDWWEDIGDTYQVYNGGTAYAIGDRVIETTLHKVYESLTAANTGNAVTDTTHWLEIGATNRWAMFDLLRNAATSVPSSMTIVLTPGERVNGWAMVGIVAADVTITMTSVGGGGTVYTYTEDLRTRIVADWYDYFFEPFSNRAHEMRIELPPFTDGIITVTLTTTEGNVELGALVIGTAVYIGQAQHSAESDVLNFSTVTRDLFGNATLVQRRNVPRTNQTVWCDKSRVTRMLAVRESLNAAPAVWSAVDDEDDGYFDALFILGIYKKFTINAAMPEHATISLELEEV